MTNAESARIRMPVVPFVCMRAGFPSNVPLRDGIRAGVRLLRSKRPDPFHDHLGRRPVGVILGFQDAERSIPDFLQVVAAQARLDLSLIHISEPTRLGMISY